MLAGDEMVVSKAGKHTYGLDRFFSSLCGKAIPGVSFFALALVSVQERQAYPISVEQIVRTEAKKWPARPRPPPKSKVRAAPKGSLAVKKAVKTR